MSGSRDYRSLLSTHRENYLPSNSKPQLSSLTTRVLNGVRSNKYKEVDYEQLRAKAQEIKFQANKSLMKVKRIEQASKDGKEQNILKQQRGIWQKENAHQAALRRRASIDSDLIIRQGSEDDVCSHLFADIEKYQSTLDKEFAQFKKDTVDPLWELRDDLKFWVLETKARRNSNHRQTNAAGELGNPDDIVPTIASVKEQQDSILKRLHNEQLSCEQELHAGYLNEVMSLSSETNKVTTGIPEEALRCTCPDESLKVDVLQEFLLVDQKYSERQAFLDDIYSDVISDLHGGWSEQEHFEFIAIMDQYPYDLQNRRMLCIDRMRRHWPHKSRQEIVAHEDWVIRKRNYQRQVKSLQNDWSRDRRELLTRAQVTFYEACVTQDFAEAQQEHKSRQQDLCDALYNKVKTWREQKMEAMAIEQRILEEELRIAAAEREAEEERVRKRREHDKELIFKRHEKLNEKRQKQAELDRQRLEELRAKLDEQAVYDAERVKHREILQIQKSEERQHKEEELRQQEEEKEQRLEALRETVRVTADPDPYRVIKDTQNWQNRRKAATTADINIHQPLFDIHTYDAQKISSDPRVKLEQRLREAGLHTTDYARYVISKTEPPQPPRRDTQHTMKFGD